MGIIYSIVSKHDCNVIATGVDCYKDEIINLCQKDPKAKATIANTVNERKNNVIKESDVLIFIPGGIGTFDEMFASIETKRAGEHDKPIFIVNINGYYDLLLAMLEKMYAEGFASESNREVYTICNSFEELKKELEIISNK